MQSKKKNTTDMLEDLLDKEYAAILEGAFEHFGQIADQKEQLLGRHKLTASDGKTLNRLRRKAERNHHLLAAAIRGVKSVTARLDNLRNGPGGLNTYDRTGQRTILMGANKGALQHRA